MNNPGIKSAAKRYGCSESTIRRWIEEKAPLDDAEAMKAWIVDRKHAPAGTKAALGMEEGTPLSRARLRKIELETQAIQHKLDVERGKYVLLSKMHEDGIRIGAVLTAELASLLNDMPGSLAGLSEIEVRKILGARVELLKTNIKAQLQKATQ